MKTKSKKKDYEFNVKFAEAEDRKSLTSVTRQGQLVVTDLGESIFMMGISVEDINEPMKTSGFWVTKEGAKDLVRHLNEILEDK